jgi:heme-degrading monooxygenase HmoA
MIKQALSGLHNELDKNAMQNSTPSMARGTVNARVTTTVLAAALAAASVATQTAAQTITNAPNDDHSRSAAVTPVAVVAVVKVPTPWYAPRALVTSKMRDTMPEYAAIPGSAFKAFSFARVRGDFGGIYFWRDKAVAQAWFSPAWFERVRKERSADAQVRYFDALISIDNRPGGTPANSASEAVGTVVEIAIPAGISRERLATEFAAAVPTYQKIPGLLRKHFIVSNEGTFGGVYLWKDDASAKAWFNESWKERVKKTYGVDAKIDWFDTPILLPTLRADNALPIGAMIVAKP